MSKPVTPQSLADVDYALSVIYEDLLHIDKDSDKECLDAWLMLSGYSELRSLIVKNGNVLRCCSLNDKMFGGLVLKLTRV